MNICLLIFFITIVAIAVGFDVVIQCQCKLFFFFFSYHTITLVSLCFHWAPATLIANRFVQSFTLRTFFLSSLQAKAEKKDWRRVLLCNFSSSSTWTFRFGRWAILLLLPCFCFTVDRLWEKLTFLSFLTQRRALGDHLSTSISSSSSKVASLSFFSDTLFPSFQLYFFRATEHQHHLPALSLLSLYSPWLRNCFTCKWTAHAHDSWSCFILAFLCFSLLLLLPLFSSFPPFVIVRAAAADSSALHAELPVGY